MSTKRFSIAVLIGGLGTKASLVFLWRLVKSPVLSRLLTTYDPVAYAFAERLASLFYDPKRIAPGPGEAELFEIALVFGFAMECLLVGLAVRWLVRRSQGAGHGSEVPVR
ncbi:MAG: hypothetical protein ABI693_33575 [Bryobacteraceae bacterium]